MKWNRTTNSVLILAVVGLVALGLFNIATNSKFFEASLTSLIQLAITIILSFYLAQKLTDGRRLIDRIDSMIRKCQITFDAVDDGIKKTISMQNADTSDDNECNSLRQIILSNRRSFSKYLTYFSGVKTSAEFKGVLDILRSNWKQYDQEFDNMNTRGRIEADIQNRYVKYGNLIREQLDELTICLYKQ